MKDLFGHTCKSVFIMTVVMVLSSCSVKTLYNQLDNLIPSYVEGMVSLDSMLEKKVEQRSLLLVKWHRNTQLNQYAEWMRGLQRDISPQLTEEKIHEHIVILERFWESIRLRVDEEMALLLPLLNKAQRKELFSSIDKKNNEFREKYLELSNDERIAEYIDSIIDNYEIWLGELTGEQEILARQAATKLQPYASYRLERRKHWQQTIKHILDTKNTGSHKSTALREFFSDYNSQDNIAMNALTKNNKNIFSCLTLQIVLIMTDEQKAYFATTTNDYLRMFDELVREQ